MQDCPYVAGTRVREVKNALEDMRTVIMGLSITAISFCALQLVYPWATYYGNFEFGWWSTMFSYFIVAVVLGGAAAGVAALVLRRTGNSAAKGIACGGGLPSYSVQ